MNFYNFKKLTEREIIILAEVLRGKTNSEIAQKFFITLHTVKAHVKNILAKTDSRHRTELISKIFAKNLNIDLINDDFADIIYQFFNN